jgi:7-cyano-7-deazaguanine synthase
MIMHKKAVVLISGGLDSSVTTFHAKQESDHIYGLSFHYGQRHNRELQSAKQVGIAAGLDSHIFFTLDLSQFGGSTLLKESTEAIPNNIPINEIGKTIPSTYVPARNTIFLSIALGYAEILDADAIYIGVTATDYSGYPDCRPEFIKAYQHMVNVATKKTVQQGNITINTPLLHLTKDEIIKKGMNLNVPFEKTWSCYQGGEKACGTCDSCKLRLKGFQNAGSPDPLIYKSLPTWYTQR